MVGCRQRARKHVRDFCGLERFSNEPQNRLQAQGSRRACRGRSRASRRSRSPAAASSWTASLISIASRKRADAGREASASSWILRASAVVSFSMFDIYRREPFSTDRTPAASGVRSCARSQKLARMQGSASPAILQLDRRKVPRKRAGGKHTRFMLQMTAYASRRTGRRKPSILRYMLLLSPETSNV